VLSHQDGHHSAVALLLKAALIQVSDYRLLGASDLYVNVLRSSSQLPWRFYIQHSLKSSVSMKDV